MVDRSSFNGSQEKCSSHSGGLLHILSNCVEKMPDSDKSKVHYSSEILWQSSKVKPYKKCCFRLAFLQVSNVVNKAPALILCKWDPLRLFLWLIAVNTPPASTPLTITRENPMNPAVHTTKRNLMTKKCIFRFNTGNVRVSSLTL